MCVRNLKLAAHSVFLALQSKLLFQDVSTEKCRKLSAAEEQKTPTEMVFPQFPTKDWFKS